MPKKTMIEETKEQIERIEQEEGEEMLLITTIKNQTAEQKATRDID